MKYFLTLFYYNNPMGIMFDDNDPGGEWKGCKIISDPVTRAMNLELPQVTIDTHSLLTDVLEEYRTSSSNTAYGSISASLNQWQIESVVNALEDKYVQLLYHALQPEESDERAISRKMIPSMRSALAEAYTKGWADTQTSGFQSFNPNWQMESKKQDYDKLIGGTLTAYLINVLKDKKLIPPNAKLSALNVANDALPR